VVKRLKRTLPRILLLIISVLLLTASITPPDDEVQRVQKYTRTIEFDYTAWELQALLRKNEQAALGLMNYLTPNQQHDIVVSCVQVTRQVNALQASLENIYSDPHDPNPDETAQPVKDDLHRYQRADRMLGPLCESILQQQVSQLVAELDLSTAGQPIPPVLYHATPLPFALIVSPRNVIQQDANISLVADLSIDEIIALENDVESGLDVSALVVPVGGIGVYPTMVKSTSDLAWQIEVVAHEWIHNYLTQRPLGLNYDTSPQLRTMNETTANLAGKEISQAVVARYYPEFLPPEAPPAAAQPQPQTQTPPAEAVFDFRAEMHETRVNVDQMLAEGKIEEAEVYMETRRQFLWENGFQIRRLNQAYFAFYGAYADQPGGAAGSDPVGPAVRQLRQQSASLAEFIRRIARMNSFEKLQQAIQ
jgi:hypothetical protein